MLNISNMSPYRFLSLTARTRSSNLRLSVMYEHMFLYTVHTEVYIYTRTIMNLSIYEPNVDGRDKVSLAWVVGRLVDRRSDDCV